ncbi:MAG: LamG-like jellyroll fold domain-containing protein [Thermomicrobiales bacterium]
MPSYKDVILNTPGLVHYFRMSGGATDADLGPGGATLTHNGSPAAASGLIKDPNGAKRYAGTTQDSTFSTAAFAGLGTISYSFWMMEDALVDWSHLVENDDWPTCRFQVLRNAASGNLTTGWRDGVGAADYGPAGPYRQLARNHVGVSADGTNIRLVINGVQVGISGMAGVFGSGTRTFRINKAGTQAHAGVLDEVAFFNVGLSVATFQQQYKAGLASGILAGLLLPV